MCAYYHTYTLFWAWRFLHLCTYVFIFVSLCDFNARVGGSVEVDDVIGKFGEDTGNASGNGLISFMFEVELVVYNGRKLVVEPEWTRVS